jgi:F-type H+-transporting ATPase subunit c
MITRTATKAKKKRTIKHFTCQTVARLPGQVIKTRKVNSMMLAELTGSLHVGLAAIGSAIGVGIIGMKAAEAVGRNPGASGKILTQAIISSALAEGIIFFAIFLVK